MKEIRIDEFEMLEIDYIPNKSIVEQALKNLDELLKKNEQKAKQELREVLGDEAEYEKFNVFELLSSDLEEKENFYEMQKVDDKKIKIIFNRNILSEKIKKSKGEIEQEGEEKKVDINAELKKYESFLQNEKEILKDRVRKEKAVEAINYLLNSFFYLNNKIVFINKKDLSYSVLDKTDVKNIIEKLIERKNLFYFDKKQKKKFMLINVANFITYIKIYNTFESIRFENDLFAKKTDVKIDKDRKEIVFLRNKILIREPKRLSIDERVKRDIIEDYKEHWGEEKLKDFLDFIVACRFANNRKKSFLNLNAPSNWGKSFLMGVLGELGVGIEARMNDLKEGTTGLSVNSVLNSFVLFIDEFKKFSNNLFKLTHSAIIEEKFKQNVKVPLYSKILMNADESESFSYAVDEQIKNRVAVMKITSNKKLDERELFKENSLLYFKIIVEFFYKEITKRIDFFLKLGEIESAGEAERTLREIGEKYKIESNFNVVDLIRETISSFILNIKDKNIDEMNIVEKKIKDYLIFEGGFVYIKAPVKTALEILKSELDDTEFKKVEYKKAQLETILQAENKVFKLNNRPVRAFKINILTLQLYNKWEIEKN